MKRRLQCKITKRKEGLKDNIQYEIRFHIRCTRNKDLENLRFCHTHNDCDQKYRCNHNDGQSKRWARKSIDDDDRGKQEDDNDPSEQQPRQSCDKPNRQNRDIWISRNFTLGLS